MTIVYSSSRAAALASSDEDNNPIVTPRGPTGTASTGLGTEVQAAANAFTGTTFDTWTATPSGSNNATLEVDYGSAKNITMAAVAAHNIADVDGDVRVQYSTDGSTWTDAGAGLVTPSDNQAIAWRFENVSARYWRFTLTGLTGDVSVGVVFIGSEIIIPQRLYQGYAPPITPTDVRLTPNVSDGGELLGTKVIQRGSTVQASIKHIPASFIRGTTWTAWQRNRYGEGQGFFWAWRPTKYGDLHYGWRNGPPLNPQNTGPQDRMSIDLDMRLYEYE